MLPAVKDITLVVRVLEGLKVIVTPVGRPFAVRTTLLLEPLKPATLTVLLALLPTTSGSVLDEEERVKFGSETVSAMVAVLLTVPLVPVTVTVLVPATAVLFAVRVSKLVVLVLVGLKAAVTPVGNPVVFKATTPELLKPLMPMVLLELPPITTGRVLAEDERLKPVDGTFRAMVVVLVAVPETPLIVTV